MPTPNEFMYLSGKGYWIKNKTINKFGSFSLNLYPDGPSLNKIMDLKARGLKNVLRKDDDGTFMVFKREEKKMMKGRLVTFLPPLTIDKEGKPFHEAIGNGSDVTIKIRIYKYKNPQGNTGIACRWEAIRIETLVPFDQESFTPDETYQAMGLTETETQEPF